MGNLDIDDDVAVVRAQAMRASWVVLAAALAALLALGADRATTEPNTPTYAGELTTFYPSTSWALAVGLLVAGIGLAVAGGRGWRTWHGPLGAVAVVTAAQLAGTGLVATKHWKTHSGFGAGVRHLSEMQDLAALMALTSAAACVVVGWRLIGWNDIPVRVGVLPRWTAAVVGSALVLWLPRAIGGGYPANQDFASYGAYALIYSLPWGVAVACSGWTARAASLAGLLAVAASAALAWIGTPMVDLIQSQPDQRPFGLVALLALAVGLVRLAGDRWRSSADEQPALTSGGT